MISLRPDLQVVADLVPEGARVLDIGCSTGELLHWLRAHKNVDGRGVERNTEKVQAAIDKGIPVVQGDVNTDLHYYPTDGYDLVILSQALQAMHDPRGMLNELLRIGKKAIVGIPNFGYWRVRLDLLTRGRMPVTKTLTHEWYNTPNIHFCTIADLIVLCGEMGITIEERIAVNHSGTPSRFTGSSWLANVFGQQGVFVLSKK